MTNKTYTIVGTSSCNGMTKVRWANDMIRVKVLQRNGHTNIELFSTTMPMNKVDAVNFMLNTHGAKLSESAKIAAQAALSKRVDSTVTAVDILEAVA